MVVCYWTVEGGGLTFGKFCHGCVTSPEVHYFPLFVFCKIRARCISYAFYILGRPGINQKVKFSLRSLRSNEFLRRSRIPSGAWGVRLRAGFRCEGRRMWLLVRLPGLWRPVVDEKWGHAAYPNFLEDRNYVGMRRVISGWLVYVSVLV